VIREVRAISAETGMRSATIGLCVVSVADGKVVLDHNSDASLVPASTVKAITTATALLMLGPEFKFVTRLQRSGEIEADGTLRGDLVILGGGDPTLGDEGDDPFERWMDAVAKAGIKRIEGRVIGDDRIFDTRLIPDGWIWGDIGNYFGAGSAGLNIGANEYRVSFRPGEAGAPAGFLRARPEPPGVTFINEMRTGPADSGDQGFIFAGPYSDLIYLRGTVPGGRPEFSIKGSLPDPAYACAAMFRAHLEAAGISVAGGATTPRRISLDKGKMPNDFATIHEAASARLASIIRDTNHSSLNLHAECILKMIARQTTGRGGTEEGARSVRAFWEQRGVSLRDFSLADGSGLSRSNFVSPRQMAAILAAAARSDKGDEFRKSLPVAGKSGTLSSVGRGTYAEGRIIGKSGTMGRIKCFAGFFNGGSGKNYAFAFFVNHYGGSHASAVSKMVRVLARLPRLP
jgi:D-alanyl-D-alanine carboxypeptidase/D-alanyl-D-alanine-endopeptidase (penicillin-binding protein 4)